MPLPAALLDVDGTLVDTNYHHAIAWFRAFRRHGQIVPVWRIHRHVGMGGDQLIEALCGPRVEKELGDDIRAAEASIYPTAFIDEVEPLEGASDLIRELKRRGHPVILASSAKEKEVEHYVELLDAGDSIDDWTTSADVARTKPHPDIVEAARAKAGADKAFLIGDSTWDCEAAKRAGVPTFALLTGGFSSEELRAAEAVAVFGSIPDLIDDLDRLLDAV